MDNHKDTDNEDIQLMEAEYYRDSDEARSGKIKSAWFIFLKSGVFVLAAFCALLIGGIAWFSSNTRVSGGGMSVRAEQNIIRIACRGERQIAEKNTFNLPDGESIVYNNIQYYYTDAGEIAMRLEENYSVLPGACGSIEFYLIPTCNGSQTVTLYLGLSGYKKDASDNAAVQVKDEALTTLLKGHLLLFKNHEEGFYSGWMYDTASDGIFDNSITVTLPENAEAGVPYPYTIYWIWPKRYENMVSHRTDKNDLYAEGSEEFDNLFFPFVSRQIDGENIKRIGTTGYYYNSIFLAEKSGDRWSLDEKARSKAYDLADEYIGTNADYLYLTIRTSPQMENSTGEGGSGE
ncbi:MAG: hypothetical protein SOW08_05770 [Lachnospiraceae bacterium]|nr:hypothetical protein [Lachnospiraceae bacterium]